MKIDNFGRVIVSEDDAVAALYSGKIKDLSCVFLENSQEVDQFNMSVKSNADNMALLPEYVNDEDLDLFDEANRCSWFMPKEYQEFPIVDWLYNQCNTIEEKNRIDQELTLFIQHGAFDVLFYLKYLVDTMRANRIVWGVGRGSSVASYALYLIGIHKINSLKYNLDIREFLKEEE
jgi:DNA polymerase III alpha subunit